MRQALTFQPVVSRWLELLRSGDFPESSGEYLCEVVNGVQRWSVFGVLCEAAYQVGGSCVPQSDGGPVVSYVSETAETKRLIPEEVRDAAGLRQICGDFEITLPDGMPRIFCLRDLGRSGFLHSELAEIIESNPVGLFLPSKVVGLPAVGSESVFDLDSRLLAKLAAMPR